MSVWFSAVGFIDALAIDGKTLGTMKQPQAIQRQVARVLLFDRQDRLVLLFDPDPDRSTERLSPEGLVEIVERLQRQGPPAEPWDISTR